MGSEIYKKEQCMSTEVSMESRVVQEKTKKTEEAEWNCRGQRMISMKLPMIGVKRDDNEVNLRL